jgi:hypothetical protein
MIYLILTIAIIALTIIALKSRKHHVTFVLAMMISWFGGFCLNRALTVLGVI